MVENMKLGILLACEHKPVYAGVNKPFINFMKYCSKNIYVEPLIYKSPELGKYFSMNGFRTFDSVTGLIEHIQKEDIDWILTDDYVRTLFLALGIKKKLNSLKVAVYGQVYHCTCQHNTIQSIIYRPLKKILSCYGFKKVDCLIANSNYGAHLFEDFFKVKPKGVVYPPVDTDVFKKKFTIKRYQIILNLGSESCKDTEEDFVKKIVEKIPYSYEILALGNEKLLNKLKREFKNKSIIYISGITDQKLAKLYSESALTICPQIWEPFGYMPVESMACGTPVLAFNHAGPAETIIDGKTGWIARNNIDFIAKLKSLLDEGIDQILDYNFIREWVVKNFSIEKSAKELEELLEVHDNEEV